ncbi:Secretagogin [Triplophysa tibetana]|uniref:Secretagogin n=1 Tax=Triplophysa tibetana TaxID=1572043 RepID=A0A5A9NKC1_9TELE|nr:Secretagogin [Triplophysa tibetana]
MDCVSTALFLQLWTQFDEDDDGFIEEIKLEEFLRLVMKTSNVSEVQKMKEKIVRSCDITADGRLHMEQVSGALLPKLENFLLIFRRETPLDNSVEFMRIWRLYDSDSSGYISAAELKSFLQDLLHQHDKHISTHKLQEYTDTMMEAFDTNQDGRLDLNDLARILALKENFLLKFQMEPSLSGSDLDKFKQVLLGHCDINGDGKIQKNELALCLGLKLNL